MKLLSIIASMNPISGGPAQGIRNNIPFWQENGIFATVVSLDDPKEAFTQNENIIALGQGKNKWAYSPKLLPWLLENLTSYDVILVHGLWLYNGYAVNIAMKKLQQLGKVAPKLFVMTHGMLDPYFQQAKNRRLKAIRNTIYWHLIEKKLINSANGVLFTCEEELQLAKKTFRGYRPKNTYNVGYGIKPPPSFSVEQKTAFENLCPAIVGKKYLLFLSRIHEKKGVDILIEAYKIVTEKFQGIGITIPHLVIAGPGLDSEYGQMIVEKVSSNDTLRNAVVFPGMLQGDTKWGAFYGCEAFVLPSHQENFGIAVAEALACSKPVLISNKVNIWREIELGEAGIIATDNLEGTISSLNQWLYLSATGQAQMGQAAYNTYLANFTAKATSFKFIEVLKS